MVRIGTYTLGLGFCLPLLGLGVGHYFLGQMAYDLFLRGQSPLVGILLGVSLLNVWAIPASIGGLFAVALGAIAAWFVLGWLGALITLGVGVAVTWFGVRQADYAANGEPTLHWWEWLGLVGTSSLAMAVTVALFDQLDQRLSDWGLGVILGLVLGAIAILGPQIQSHELPPKLAYGALVLAMVVGLCSGAIAQSFFQPRFFA